MIDLKMTFHVNISLFFKKNCMSGRFFAIFGAIWNIQRFQRL